MHWNTHQWFTYEATPVCLTRHLRLRNSVTKWIKRKGNSTNYMTNNIRIMKSIRCDYLRICSVLNVSPSSSEDNVQCKSNENYENLYTPLAALSVTARVIPETIQMNIELWRYLFATRSRALLVSPTPGRSTRIIPGLRKRALQKTLIFWTNGHR